MLWKKNVCTNQINSTPKIIGLLGGTFDPIHHGHLHIARAVQKDGHFNEIQFIPCYIPPHQKKPIATPAQRLQMLELALVDEQNFSINPIEFLAQKISYTVDTIQSITASNPHDIFCFIMGDDSFLHFHTWEGADEILKHCHLIITHRPNTQPIEESATFSIYRDHIVNSAQYLSLKKHGCIYPLTPPPCDISATQIREHIKKGDNISMLVPEKVNDYIQLHALYAT